MARIGCAPRERSLTRALSDKISTVCVSDLVIEHLPPGKLKFFVLDVSREAMCDEQGGVVGSPSMLEHPEH